MFVNFGGGGAGRKTAGSPGRHRAEIPWQAEGRSPRQHRQQEGELLMVWLRVAGNHYTSTSPPSATTPAPPLTRRPSTQSTATSTPTPSTPTSSSTPGTPTSTPTPSNPSSTPTLLYTYILLHLLLLLLRLQLLLHLLLLQVLLHLLLLQVLLHRLLLLLLL